MLTFTEAIEDIGKRGEPVPHDVIHKLKSHAKVYYQDHPEGDKRCAGCTMFQLGPPVSCSLVKPPISPNGYCSEFERVDANMRARQMLEASLGVKFETDGSITAKSFNEIIKDGPQDEARDEHGRWTSGGGSTGAFEQVKQGKFEFGSGKIPAGFVLDNPFHDRNSEFILNAVTDAGKSKLEQTKEVTQLSVRDLRSWQSVVKGSEHQDISPLRDGYPPISVYKINGQYIIKDGNHRAVSAFVEGRDKIDANVLDLDAPENQKYLKKPYRTVKVFDPGEARDDKGMWTSGGDHAAISNAHDNVKATSRSYDDQAGKVREAKQKVQELTAQMSGAGTDDLHAGLQRQLELQRQTVTREESELQRQGEQLHGALGRLGDAAGRSMGRLGDKLGIVKAFDPDEARDDHGRWSTSGDHILLHSTEATDIAERVAPHEEGFGEKMRDIENASTKLFHAGEDAAEAEQKGDDHETEHGERNAALDAETEARQADAGKAAIELHGHLHELVGMAKEAEDHVASKMQEYGMRQLKKAFDPDEARDDHGRWTSGGAVEEHLSALRDAGTDKAKFDDAMEHVRQLKTPELTYVAQKYSLYPGKFKSKSEAIDYIERAFVRNARFENRIKRAVTFDEVIKGFDPNEARDAHGRWTGGGESASHPDWMHGDDGAGIASSMEEVPQGMHDSVDKVEEARQALEDASSHASDLSEDEPDGDSKEFNAWEKEHNAALADVADKTMALHDAVAEHLDATHGVLDQLRERINAHAKDNGVRPKV